MLLKVCGLNNIENIRELLPQQPDVLGFVFHPASRRYAGGSEPLAAFVSGIEGVRKAGVFVAATAADIWSTAALYRLDMVQLHGGQSPAFCAAMKEAGLAVIKVFSVGAALPPPEEMDAFKTVCDYFLFDTATQHHGGSGEVFSWQLLDGGVEHPFFLSGGISPANVSEALQLSHPYFAGIDINSRYETAPGIKNTTLVKQTIDEIRSR